MEKLRFVWGPPGTGKTTFLAKQVEALVDRNQNPLVCSLTRTAAREIASRNLPIDRRSVGTLHSHAYRALGHSFEVAEAKVDSWNEAHPLWMLPKVRSDALEEGGGDAPGTDDGERLYAALMLRRAREIPKADWPEAVLTFSDAWEAWKTENALIDFSDMIELCVAGRVELPDSPGVIIVDEAQDHSRLEMRLVLMWAAQCREGAILAGDPYQALYTWRGADPTMFLSGNIPEDRRRILRQSHRVPAAVHAVAMDWIKRLSGYEHIDYYPRDAQGSVGAGPPLVNGTEVAGVAEAAAASGKSVMVMATCGYLLLPVLAALRERGVPFSNPWRRQQGAWNPLAPRKGTSLVERFDAFSGCDPVRGWWTWTALGKGIEALRAGGLLERGAKKLIKERAANEFLADLQVADADLRRLFIPLALEELRSHLMKFRENRREDLLRWWMERVLPRHRKHADYIVRIVRRYGGETLTDEPRVYVGTCHSFKGAEADVVLLAPDLSPAGQRAWLAGVDTGRDDVRRTIYVGMTRARERLVLLEPSGQRSVHWRI